MSFGTSPLDEGTVADWLTDDATKGACGQVGKQPTRLCSADSSIGPADITQQQGSERAKLLAKRIASGVRSYRHQHPEVSVADLKLALQMLLNAMERSKE